MVKVPALAEDGQNWKFYRAKLLEHAAMKGWLNVLAGEPDEDWEGCNALLHEVLHDTIPISIYIRLRRNTAHQVFKYLAKRFCDREPIADPRAKKLATCANEVKHDPSAKAPTSENAATGADWEDPPTKDLTRGIEDVGDGNVGREDPRTKAEASSKGTSTKCTETTAVVLESAPHETQDRPQNSLQATPQRLPIEDEPCACEQEAADSAMTAEHTSGTLEMVGTAKPHKTDADVDGTAALGGEPAERVQGVSEGNETERDSQSRLQQTNLCCKEGRQRNENANSNIPNTYGVPLEGEWTGYASGEMRNSSGHADESIAALSVSTVLPELMDGPSESRKAEDTARVELRGCRGGTSQRASIDEPGVVVRTPVECCQQLCMADTPNESETLVIASIESESPDSGGIPRVHLGSTSSRAGDANGCGNRADASSCQADASTGSTDVMGTSYRAETDGMSNCEGAGTYLGAGGTNRIVNATDGVGSQSDASTGHGDVPCDETHANSTANATQNIRTPRKPKKPPDSPMQAERQHSDKPNGFGNHAEASSGHTDVPSVETDALTTVDEAEIVRTSRNESKMEDSPMETAKRTPDVPNGSGSHTDASSVHTDTHCVGNATETTENATKNVRTRTKESETRNSPNGRNIATPELPGRWRKVSIGGGAVCVPLNTPIAVPTRQIVFGRVESGVEAIAPIVESERACDGDGDGEDAESGGNVDSQRVEGARLSTESQHVCLHQKSQENSPASSRPPVQHERHPNGLVRRRRRRGRLKIERINVSQAWNGETTYIERAYATQPLGNPPNRAYGVYRPRRRRGRIKIATINVSRTRNGGNAYLGRVNATRSTRRPERRIRRLDKLTFEFKMPGEPWRDDEDHR